jgi:uridine kinase
MNPNFFVFLCFIFSFINIWSSEPLIIAVAGGSGAGKSFLAKAIVELFEGDVELISQDSYYKDLSHLSQEERDLVNFDHPEAIDFPLLKKHLMELKEGRSIEEPTYDFATHLRTSKVKVRQPKRVIVVEGILLLAVSEMREVYDVKCFVDADDELRLFRRIERDISERGRTLEGVRVQYFKTVQPMYKKFVLPSKNHADIIIPSNEENPVAVDLVVSALENKKTLERRFTLVRV